MIPIEPLARTETPRRFVLAFVAGLAWAAGSTGLAETYLVQLTSALVLGAGGTEMS